MFKFPKSKYNNDLAIWKKDPTVFWSMNKQPCPLLSRLWRRVRSIKAASASAERVFSVGGFITSGRRWNLSADSIKNIVLLNQWTKSGLLN